MERMPPNGKRDAYSGQRPTRSTVRREAGPGGQVLEATVFGRIRRVGIGGLLLRYEALATLRRVQRELATSSVKDVQSSFVDMNRQPRPVPKNRVDVGAVGNAVMSASRYVPEVRCVAQSLAAQVMLSRRSISTRMHFGFRRRPDGTVTGHAWLEANSTVVIGDEGLDDFTKTAFFDA